MRSDKEDRWLPRLMRWPGPRQAVVAVAAVLLTVSALGFLIWALTTRSASRLVWQTSIATVLAVVLASWGMSAAMLAWVVRSRRPVTETRSAHAIRARNPAPSDLPCVPIAIPRRFPERLHGRERLIADLDAAGPGEIVLLCGMGGVGKTAVAAAIAEHYEAAGLSAYWVNCLDPRTVGGSMLAVAQAAGMPEGEAARLAVGDARPTFDEIWRYLDRRREVKGWLLVFDNADTPAALAAPGGAVADLTGWLRPSRHGPVIVTSRNRDLATWGPRVRAHELRPLSPADGAQVLRDRAPAASMVDADVVALSQRLGNLPLALQVAGAYLASPVARHPDAASYLAALRNDPAQALSQTWEITLQTLVNSGYPQARRVLWLLAILHRRPVPLDFVRLLARAPARLAGIGRSPDNTDAMIAQLHAFSLVTVQRDAARAVIELHPLIAETYRAEGLRSRRGGRLLQTILWGVAEHFAGEQALTTAELRAAFVDVTFDLMGPGLRRPRVIREAANAAAGLVTCAANSGNIALGYHYLAIAQIATGTVPRDNPRFPHQDIARRDRPIYRPAEPPTPHAAGLAWPAIWLAADRRYDEAIQCCRRILDLDRSTQIELLRVRRVLLDLRMTHEGWCDDMLDEYSRICAAEDAQPAGMRTTDAGDRTYTLYLGRYLYYTRTIYGAWMSGSDVIPGAVSRRFSMISAARVPGMYIPLYRRRRLQQVPATAQSDPGDAVRRAQRFWLPAGGRRQLSRLDALLRRKHAEFCGAADSANPPLSKDDVAVRVREDPGWAASVGILTALNDQRGWTRIRRNGVDWIALLDDYDWGPAELDAIKFMASLRAEAPPYPISVGLVFHIGYQSPRDQRVFDLQIQAMCTYRGVAPRTAPKPTAAARARAGEKRSDSYYNTALYVLAVVDDDRLWAHVDPPGIAWHDILAVADQELSDSRRVLLALAASLFSNSFTVSLNDAVNRLDEADFETAVHAMKVFRGAADW